MSSEQKKRVRPATKSRQRLKRQRVESALTNVSTHALKLPVALNRLPWNEVKVPEMFEDAEGFFGLEEVDDVEVVRDGNTVKFVGVYSSYNVSNQSPSLISYLVI
jgi:ATP-dependent RNA helicase DDX24/MAK5